MYVRSIRSESCCHGAVAKMTRQLNPILQTGWHLRKVYSCCVFVESALRIPCGNRKPCPITSKRMHFKRKLFDRSAWSARNYCMISIRAVVNRLSPAFRRRRLAREDGREETLRTSVIKRFFYLFVLVPADWTKQNLYFALLAGE